MQSFTGNFNAAETRVRQANDHAAKAAVAPEQVRAAANHKKRQVALAAKLQHARQIVLRRRFDIHVRRPAHPRSVIGLLVPIGLPRFAPPPWARAIAPARLEFSRGRPGLQSIHTAMRQLSPASHFFVRATAPHPSLQKPARYKIDDYPPRWDTEPATTAGAPRQSPPATTRRRDSRQSSPRREPCPFPQETVLPRP